MKRITIIGGGASGTLVGANLLRHAADLPIEINLVETRARVGRGVAFGTAFDTHLLNVPAAKMGAFPDAIGHFHEWLTSQGLQFEANAFVPRRIYGEYLNSVFADSTQSAGNNVRLNLIDDEAVDMSVNANSAEVILRSGEVLPSDSVVLAFGNFKPPHPTVADLSFTASHRYFQDPWSSNLYDHVGGDQTIFIVGTGLSMVDVVLHAHKLGHRGKIAAISTRGLLPAVHELGHTYDSFETELRPMRRITDIQRTVRRHIRDSAAKGGNWRGVIDSLRPATQQIWLDLPLAEKKYFMQHLSRYWNVARHRMPPEAAQILEELQATGQFRLLKGRLTEIHEDESGQFHIRYSSDGSENSESADLLVNCIGSQSNFQKVDSLFVSNLMSRGHIRNDGLSMGVDASPDGRVIGKDGRPSTVVHTLGTALKGVLWETTAIPEIRVQAHSLALKLLSN